MAPRLAIRVDASTQIGFGHLKRCTSLAKALRELGASVVFVTRRLDMPSAAHLASEGWELRELPSPAGDAVVADDGIAHGAWARVDMAIDAHQTIETLRNESIAAVVVDHYSFDTRWHVAVSAALHARMVVIDDLADRRIAADLIVDHNYSPDHEAKYGHLNESRATVLGGPRYALLDPVYAHAPRHVWSREVRSIGIFMGGADALGYSAKVLDATRRLAGFRGEIQIVTTRGNPHLAALRDAAAQAGSCTVTVDLPDLSGFFARHDLHVGAGGGATWERCCMGVAALAIVVADNQRHVVDPLQALDVLHAVPAVLPSEEQIAAELRRTIENAALRERLCANGRQLVDGLGAQRVAHHLINACKP